MSKGSAPYGFRPVTRICACGREYAYINSEDTACPDCRTKRKKRK